MPLYRDTARGYEVVYQPIDGHMYLTHRLADEWNLRHGIYAEVAGTHRHHMDFDRRNNRPTNIERMPASEHIRLHNDHSYGEDFDAQAHGAAIRDSLLRRSQDVQWRAHFSEVQSQRARESPSSGDFRKSSRGSRAARSIATTAWWRCANCRAITTSTV